jgi:hypothetical protein
MNLSVLSEYLLTLPDYTIKLNVEIPAVLLARKINTKNAVNFAAHKFYIFSFFLSNIFQILMSKLKVKYVNIYVQETNKQPPPPAITP